MSLTGLINAPRGSHGVQFVPNSSAQYILFQHSNYLFLQMIRLADIIHKGHFFLNTVGAKILFLFVLVVVSGGVTVCGCGFGCHRGGPQQGVVPHI